jgi:hypothetical protein
MGRCGAGPGATHDKASNNPSKATSRIRKCDHRVESNRGNLSCWGTLFLNPKMPRRLQSFGWKNRQESIMSFVVRMSVWLDGKSIRPAVERHTGFIEEAVLTQISAILPVQRLAESSHHAKGPKSNRSVTSQKYKLAGDPVSPRKTVRGLPTGLKPSSSADPSGKRQWSAPESTSTIQSTVRSLA